MLFSYHDLGEPMAPGGYSGVIIMGGPMSANDPVPGLANELALIRRALDAGTPLLGICLGAQMIAKALGARVYRNAELEIGWAPVHLTEGGRADPVLSGLPSPATLFHWHGEAFDLPAGAEWLAWSAKCRNQAFRYGSRVYGLQFHPEVTAAMIADWCEQPVNCGDMAAVGQAPDPSFVDLKPVARQIVNRWLDLF